MKSQVKGESTCLSASSRITILCLPEGKVTFFCANPLILFRTTSMPLQICFQHRKYEHRGRPTCLSSDAFSSRTPSLYASPKSWCAKQWMLVVFPIPGRPCYHAVPSGRVNMERSVELTEMMICGQFPSRAMTFSRSIVSEFPTMSSRSDGLYFSTLCGYKRRVRSGSGDS